MHVYALWWNLENWAKAHRKILMYETDPGLFALKLSNHPLRGPIRILSLIMNGIVCSSVHLVCSSRPESITVLGQWLKRLDPTHSVLQPIRSILHWTSAGLIYNNAPRLLFYESNPLMINSVTLADYYRGGVEVKHLFTKVSPFNRSRMVFMITPLPSSVF